MQAIAGYGRRRGDVILRVPARIISGPLPLKSGRCFEVAGKIQAIQDGRRSPQSVPTESKTRSRWPRSRRAAGKAQSRIPSNANGSNDLRPLLQKTNINNRKTPKIANRCGASRLVLLIAGPEKRWRASRWCHNLYLERTIQRAGLEQNRCRLT